MGAAIHAEGRPQIEDGRPRRAALQQQNARERGAGRRPTRPAVSEEKEMTARWPGPDQP